MTLTGVETVGAALTAFNRGRLFFHHTLPRAAFLSNVRCVIAATDSAAWDSVPTCGPLPLHAPP